MYGVRHAIHGDHVHYGEREERYAFTTLETLLEDFQADVIRLTQE